MPPAGESVPGQSPSAASTRVTTASTVRSASPPRPNRTAVAPNPGDRTGSPDGPDRRDGGLEAHSAGLGHRQGPPAGGVEGVEVERHVERVHPGGDRRRPGAERRETGRRAEHPGPEVGHPRRGEHPRLGLVQDLAAEERRLVLPDRRAVTGCHEVRVASPEGHREGHPPDVPRGRGVRRVEVAVGVEPGEREPRSRAGRGAGRPAPRLARAVAAEQEEPGGGRLAGRVVPIAQGPIDVIRRVAAGTRRSAPGSSPLGRRRGPARLVRDVAGVAGSGSRRDPGRATRRSTIPRRRSSAGVRSIPPKWPPSAVGEPTMTIVSFIRRGYGARPPARTAIRDGMIGRCASPTSSSSATSPAGSSPSATCSAASDVEGYPMAELLALADDETRALWDGPPLGLHGVDRAPAAAGARSPRSTSGSSPTTCSSSPAPRRPSSASPTCSSGRATTRS